MAERSNSPKVRSESNRNITSGLKNEKIISVLNDRWRVDIVEGDYDYMTFYDEYFPLFQKLEGRVKQDITNDMPFKRS